MFYIWSIFQRNFSQGEQTSLCQNLSAPASSTFLERQSKVGKGEGMDNIGFTLTSDSIIEHREQMYTQSIKIH